MKRLKPRLINNLAQTFTWPFILLGVPHRDSISSRGLNEWRSDNSPVRHLQILFGHQDAQLVKGLQCAIDLILGALWRGAWVVVENSLGQRPTIAGAIDMHQKPTYTFVGDLQLRVQHRGNDAPFRRLDPLHGTRDRHGAYPLRDTPAMASEV